jgi:predicted peptidase
MKKLHSLLIFFLILGKTYGQIKNPPFSTAGNQVSVPKGSSNLSFGYYEYLPTNFNLNSNQKYPVILFFHGQGEVVGNGTTELNKIISASLPKSLNDNSLDLPAIVISPQTSESFGNFYESNIKEIYDYIASKYPLDVNRFYVTGLSIGGGNTWVALDKIADKIAAAIPICGAGNVTNPSPSLRSMPIWAFHNFSDPKVQSFKTINNCDYIANISNSCMTVYPFGPANTVSANDQTLQFELNTLSWKNTVGVVPPTNKLGYTIYNKTNLHDAWTATYNNPAVFNWLFAQSRTTLAIQDFEIENQNICPNPTNGILNLSKNLQNKRIEIFNNLGEKIKTIENSTEILDLNNLNAGIYFLNIKSSTNKTIRIIKE